jgi:hypothetical protein
MAPTTQTQAAAVGFSMQSVGAAAPCRLSPEAALAIASQQPRGRLLFDCVVLVVAEVVELAGSVIERQHGLHWNTYKFSANARLMTDKVIGWPQVGHATPSLGVWASLMSYLSMRRASSGHDMDQIASHLSSAVHQHGAEWIRAICPYPLRTVAQA